MTDFPASPIPAGPYDDVTCIAYAVNELTKVVYQAYSAFNTETGVMGYVTYDIAAETGVWHSLLGELGNFDPEVDRIHAFWLLPGSHTDEDFLCILHSEEATNVFASIFNAGTGLLVDHLALTNEGDGTSFLTQHPQIIALPPTEGPGQWYIVSFSEDTDKMSVFELFYDSVNFTIEEHMYNASSGVGGTLSKQFTWDDLNLYVPSTSAVNLTIHEIQLSTGWAPPVVGTPILDASVGPVLDVLMVYNGAAPRLLASVEEATFKTFAWDSVDSVWSPVYQAGHLVDDFTESKFLSYAALDKALSVAHFPHLRGSVTTLMSEDSDYTIFCFGPGEYHDISPLGTPIHASSITYDFYVRHALDENDIPQLAYFVDAGLDEFCRPIATVRYV